MSFRCGIATDGLGSVSQDRFPLTVAAEVGTTPDVADGGGTRKSIDDALTFNAEAKSVISCMVGIHDGLLLISRERSLLSAANAVGTTHRATPDGWVGLSNDGRTALNTETTSPSCCISVANTGLRAINRRLSASASLCIVTAQDGE